MSSLVLSYQLTLVAPYFRLPLGDRHGAVADLRLPVGTERQIYVLEPVLVVALGEVGSVVGAAALRAVDRREDSRLGAVEHEPELERREDVLVENASAVIDRNRLVLLLQALDHLERL